MVFPKKKITMNNFLRKKRYFHSIILLKIIKFWGKNTDQNKTNTCKMHNTPGTHTEVLMVRGYKSGEKNVHFGHWC